ncbi:hypothetical protein [Flocculibacter collagenilyticus]|uniref:hypothetical protein n=1 Tax=Flocculibacter collagenilyticus TaxID=2744479 RepID=UPI0018F54A71|nr:hypothetical protein [Flocculibacter collagenilyticus]
MRSHILLISSILAITACDDIDLGKPDSGETVPNTLTIQGKAGTTPLAGASVTLTVGDKSYNTATDQAGVYSIEIETSTSNANEAVIVSVQGTEEGDEHIVLKSQLGSVSTLNEYAGDDETLTNDEYGLVDVTPFTTAAYILLDKIDVNQKPILQAKWTDIVHSSELADLATAIDFAVERPRHLNQHSIYSGIDNTFELASNSALVSEYLKAISYNRKDFYVHYGLSWYDSLPTISVSDVVGTYYISNVFSQSSISSAVLVLENGNTGSYVDQNREYEITWAVDNNKVTIVPTQDNFSNTSEHCLSTTLSNFLNCDIYLSQFTLSFLAPLGLGTDSVLVNQASRLDFAPYGESIEESRTYYSIGSLYRESQAELPQNHVDLEKTYSIFVPQINSVSTDEEWVIRETKEALKFTLSGESTASGTVSIQFPIYSQAEPFSYKNMTGTWTVESDNTLAINVEAVDELSYLKIAFFTDKNQEVTVSTLFKNVEVEQVGYGSIVEQQVTTFDSDSMAGILSYARNSTDPLDHFWFEFDADGTYLSISTDDMNKDGILTADEVLETQGKWQVSNDGKLLLRRYKESDTGEICLPDTFDVLDGELCQLYLDREVELLQSSSSDQVSSYTSFIRNYIIYHDFMEKYFFSFVTTWYVLEERPIALPED